MCLIWCLLLYGATKVVRTRFSRSIPYQKAEAGSPTARKSEKRKFDGETVEFWKFESKKTKWRKNEENKTNPISRFIKNPGKKEKKSKNEKFDVSLGKFCVVYFPKWSFIFSLSHTHKLSLSLSISLSLPSCTLLLGSSNLISNFSLNRYVIRV